MVRWIHPTLGTFEGSVTEIAESVRRLHALAVQPPAAPDGVVPPFEETSQLPLIPLAPASRRLTNPPSNELLLQQYSEDVGLSPGVRRAHVSAARELEHHVAPLSLLDVTQDEIRSYERLLLENCAHLQTRRVDGPRAALVPTFCCMKGLFGKTVVKPESCASSCRLFQRQMTGPRARLGRLKHLYEWLRSRGLVDRNPVEFVLRRHSKTVPSTDGPAKYSPSQREARLMIGAAREVLTLRDVAVLLCFAKWGRRPDHTLFLEAQELRGVMLHEEGPAYASFAGVRDRVLSRNLGGGTKLKGNVVSPIDDELLAFLRDEYMPYRQTRWGFAWNEGPLFPGNQARGRFNYTMLQEFLFDPVMAHLAATAPTERERDVWREHARKGSPTQITPGCFRHFFTTRLEEFGLPELDIDILRGDRVKGSKREYLHMTPEKVCAKYPRGFELLAVPEGQASEGA
jgi:integrase